MPNHILLEEAKNMELGDLANLSSSDLASLQIQAIHNLDDAKRQKDWIDGAISIKYQERSCNIRNINNKMTGTISFNDENFKVSSNLAKKIEWDQTKLKQVVSDIKEFGDNPYEYVTISYKVPENKYNSWPEHIKKIFSPARLLKTGKETFKFEAISGGRS